MRKTGISHDQSISDIVILRPFKKAYCPIGFVNEFFEIYVFQSCRVESGITPAPPSQNRSCSFPAVGSSQGLFPTLSSNKESFLSTLPLATQGTYWWCGYHLARQDFHLLSCAPVWAPQRTSLLMLSFILKVCGHRTADNRTFIRIRRTTHAYSRMKNRQHAIRKWTEYA